MCNFSGKLMAWLDHELPENEAADVERHVKGCEECRSRVHVYEETGDLFEAYCAAVMELKAKRNRPLWTPVLAGAALIAVAVAVLLAFLPVATKRPTPIEQLPVHALSAAPAPSVVNVGATSTRSSQQRHASARPQNSGRTLKQNPARNAGENEGADWISGGQNIQIAIPADAVFPPGVVPEGVNFIADLSIAADGSAERLDLRP